MFTKNLFKLSTLLIVLTIVMSVGVFAQTTWLVNVTNGDDGFGNGSSVPYKSISKAISVAATGDIISVAAGIYDQANTGAAAENSLAVTGTLSLSFVATAFGGSNVVTITNGFNMNSSGTVNLGLTGLQFNLGTTATALQVTQGTLNITTANVIIGSGGTLTINNVAVLNAPPTKTSNLNVAYTGAGSMSTSTNFPAALGSGTLSINRTSGTLTVAQALSTTGTITIAGAGAVSFTADVASGTITNTSTGAVSFSGNLTLGSAAIQSTTTAGVTATAAVPANLVHNSNGAMTVGTTSSNTLTLYSEGNGATDNANAAKVGRIINQALGTLTVNSAVILNVKNNNVLAAGAGPDFAPTNALISNANGGAGAVTTFNASVSFVNANFIASSAPTNDIAHTVIIENLGTGTLTFASSILTPLAGGSNRFINVIMNLTGAGTVATRDVALRAGTVTNTGALTMGNANDAWTVSGTFTNSAAATAIVTVNGTATFSGNVVTGAGSKMTFTNSVCEMKGNLTNAGVMVLGSNSLKLSGASAILNNTGDIYSTATATVGTGTLNFTGNTGPSSTGTGNLPALTITTTGTFTFTGASALYGALTKAGSGTLTVNGTLTENSDIQFNAGNITMGTAGIVVKGTFYMNSGAGNFTFGANTLDLKGNFVRVGGTILAAQAGTGTLQFSGSTPQQFSPGVLMNVFNVIVANTGIGVLNTDIVTQDASLVVLNDYAINSGRVSLGTSNIRMTQSATSARFTNGGRGYTATGVGGVIFQGAGTPIPSGGAGTGAVITGSNAFSNIYVRLTTPTNNVFCLGTVTISGIVSLESGGITWNQATVGGDAFTTSTLTLDQSLTGTAFPNVVVSTDNDFTDALLLDGADGGAVPLAITTKYDLSYIGTTSRTVAGEFVPASLNALSILTTNSNTITGPASATAITGALTINPGQSLQLDNGGTAYNLTASGNVTHSIRGSILSTLGTAQLILTGTSVTLNGASAASDQAAIANLTINTTGSVTSAGLKSIVGTLLNTAGTSSITMNTTTANVGDATLTAGSLNLVMAASTSTQTGNILVTAGNMTYTRSGGALATRTVNGTITLNGGTLTLGSHIDVNGAVTQSAGNLALADLNLTLNGGYTRTGAGTISAGAGQFIVTGTNTLTFNASSQIPNLTINGVAITIAGAGVEITGNLVHTAGAIDFGNFNVTLSGTNWTYTAGTYTTVGTGALLLTGTAVVIDGVGANPSVPYVTINTTGSVTFNPDNSGASPAARKLTITQLLTQTKGALILGINDVEFSGGTGYAFTAGTITATSTGANIGELLFTGAAGLTPGTLKSLSIPNLRIEAATTIAGTDTFYVTNNFIFGKGGNVTFAVDGRLILADGALVTRVENTGALSNVPSFAGNVDVAYVNAALPGNITTGKELPVSTTNLRNLTVNVVAGVGTSVLLNANCTVNGTLALTAGILNLTANSKAVNLAIGSTVSVSAGSVNAPITPAGAYNLVYANKATNVTSTVNEWPSTATISNLTVSMGNATGPVNTTLFLVGSRTVGTFTLNCNTTASSFDLSNGGSAFKLTVTGLTTLTKGTLMTTTTGGSIEVQGDVNASGGSFGGTVQMAFTGASNQTVTTPSGGASIGNITINKAAGTNKVMITGGDLTCSGIVTFNNGLIVTDASNALVLTNGAGATTAKGYTRALVSGGTSHVVGNVKQNLEYSTLIAYARNEFPVGDTVNYRPVALTFLSTSSGNFGIFATVSHTNSRPTGTAGLPIANGIANGISLAKYPGFFWSIKTDGPMGNTAFNLDLTAAGDATLNLGDVGLNQVKIIRRSGVALDVQNQWNLQGARDSYDNVVSNSIPTVIAVNATGGLSTSGAIFTYGLKSNLQVINPPANLTGLVGGGAAVKVPLSSIFGGNTGALVYSVTSSNTAAATVALVATGDTAKVTPVAAGTSTITVTALDVDGSNISTTFTATVINANVTVSGTVSYGATTNTIGAVTVTLTPASGAPMSAISNASGVYSIANVPAGAYTLTASKTGNWGGCTAADALLITRHVVGLSLLAGLPLQAADVNASGSITAADALLITRRVVGLDATFSGGDWTFASQSLTVASGAVTANVSGLAVGDVNASYTPASGTAFAKSASLSLTNGTEKFGVATSSSVAIGSVTLRISAQSAISEITSKLPGFVSQIDGSNATVAWSAADGKTAVQLNANEAIATVKLADKAVAGSSVSITTEMTDINGAAINSNVAVATLPMEFSLMQNYPNPFNPSTTINYNLPQSGKVTLTIFNIMGQEVAKLVNEQKDAGSYSVEWAPKNLASGMYIYRINVQTEKELLTSSKRLMLLK